MANLNWYNESPTDKQIELFKSLKAEFGYDSKPTTKGEYREAIALLMQKQTEAPKVSIQPTRRSLDWMDAYDDDYLGDQGIFPGY